MSARGLFDELVFIFILVMFIRMFVVEIYKIPTGSMTPTLLGGNVSHVDVTGDGHEELLFWDASSAFGPLMYRWDGQRFIFDQRLPISPQQYRDWKDRGLIRTQNDRIMVTKLPYLFRQPSRGDIVVFKVPPVIYDPDTPIYIKRVAGEPGETLRFSPDGRLMADGETVRQPEFFSRQHYQSFIDANSEDVPPEEILYERIPGGRREIVEMNVPEDEVYVLGDNAHGSRDSRYWGGVPLEAVKGRAFLRIFPFSQIRFLQ